MAAWYRCCSRERSSWPAQRSLRYAFGRAYLDSLYHHDNEPLKLAWARVRHAVITAQRDRRVVMRQLRGDRL